MVKIFSASNWILTFLVIYFVLIVGIGLYYLKKSKVQSDFVVAGRSLTLPFVTASVVATWIGAAVIIGGATEAFTGGFQAITWDPFAPMVTLIISGVFFVKMLRKAKYETLVDFFTNRFDKRMAGAISVIQFISGMTWVSAQLLSLGVIIRLSTGFDAVTATILGSIAILILAISGGMYALSRTDMLACIIMIISLVIMFPYALNSVGGMGAFIEGAGNLEGLPPFSLFYSTATSPEGQTYGFSYFTGILGFTYAVSAWITVGIGDLASPVLTTRAMSAKDSKTASKSFILAGIIYLALGLIPVFIGMCVYILQPGFPVDQLDDVLPWFVQNYIPVWAGVLFVVAIAAAITSTAGDCVLIDSALIGKNLYEIIKPGVTEKDTLKAIKIIMPIFVILALLIGLKLGTIYKLLVFSGAMVFPTITPSYIGGMVSKKTNSHGAFASFIAGLASWIILYFVGYPFIEDLWDTIYIMSVPAFVISLIALFVVSALTQKSCPPKPLTDIDGKDISNISIFAFAKDED